MMLIDIKQNARDPDMYELWQLHPTTGEARWLMAVVHVDLLEQDVQPCEKVGETQMRVEMRPHVEPDGKMCPHCQGSGLAVTSKPLKG
jgi:autonomous glycyl radical cofactor GrcA